MATNFVVLCGNLTRDPETYLGQDQKIRLAKFTLAVGRNHKDGVADFIPVTVFDKTAELCAKYLSKGSKVIVSGRVDASPYKDKNGNLVRQTRIVGNSVDFASTKKEGGAAAAKDFSQIDTKEGNPFDLHESHDMEDFDPTAVPEVDEVFN